MRARLLSLPYKIQILLIVGLTVAVAFSLALFCGMFFDMAQLKENTSLITTVYQVMGTIYAILITFTLWGVWQQFTEAETSVQREIYSLLDLVHNFEAVPRWLQFNIRKAALLYAQTVTTDEWNRMKSITSSTINFREKTHSLSTKIVLMVQDIVPDGPRELAVFSQVITQLNHWLDARRSRLLIARGNSARSLWSLLLMGAFVLFSIHGLFVADTVGIWATLLAGISAVIGLTFYLIFTLDCPFTGSPCVDTEPFDLAIQLLSSAKTEV